jgi:hypothetical protein
MMGRDLILSILMFATVALVAGGVHLLRKGKGEDRKRAWLMLAAALVMFVNVLIWTV